MTKKTKNVKHVMSEFVLSNFIEICLYINLYLHIYIFFLFHESDTSKAAMEMFREHFVSKDKLTFI